MASRRVLLLVITRMAGSPLLAFFAWWCLAGEMVVEDRLGPPGPDHYSEDKKSSGEELLLGMLNMQAVTD